MAITLAQIMTRLTALYADPLTKPDVKQVLVDRRPGNEDFIPDLVDIRARCEEILLKKNADITKDEIEYALTWIARLRDRIAKE